MDEINWSLIILALNCRIKGLEHMIDKYSKVGDSARVENLCYQLDLMKDEYRKVLVKQQESNRD